MTWTKLSDNFGDLCADLSDAAFRTHVEGLLWTMRRETDGRIGQRDLRRLAESPHADAAVSELVTAGWWVIDGQGYRIVHHMEHQPEPDVIRARRAMDAERQRRKRRKAAGLKDSEADPSRRDITRDTHRDDPRDPGRVGTGRDGSKYGEGSTHNDNGAVCIVCGVRPSSHGFAACSECATPIATGTRS